MRRDLRDLLVQLGWYAAAVLSWLLLAVLLSAAASWLAGPVRAAPLPFARPAKPAPPWAGSWWWRHSDESAWEIFLCPDGFVATRCWDAHGPGNVYVGAWRVEDGRLQVKEHFLLPCGHVAAYESAWSCDLASLKRTR